MRRGRELRGLLSRGRWSLQRIFRGGDQGVSFRDLGYRVLDCGQLWVRWGEKVKLRTTPIIEQNQSENMLICICDLDWRAQGAGFANHSCNF